jgi:hypothetical protein
MKQTILVISFLAIALLMWQKGFSQITFEAEYNHSGAYVQLALSGNKFYVMDVANSQCRIYNTDHTLWKTINLSVPANHYLYDIKYVSENLFAIDNSLALCYTYYTYDEVNQYYTYTTKVVKENGTELLSIPGGQYAYAFSLSGEGTKFMVYAYDYSIFPYTVKTLLYELPGEVYSSNADQENHLLSRGAHPNPAKEFTIIPYQLPKGENRGLIVVSNVQGLEIASYPVEENMGNVHVHTAQLPAGIYFYNIRTGKTTSKAGKLIVK